MRNLVFLVAILGLTCMVLQCNNDNNNDDPDPDNGNGNEKEQLPPATQSGKGTFGCKVNGEVWVPEAPPNINELHADYYQDEFSITAQKNIAQKNIDNTISIGVNSGWRGEGNYTVSSLDSNKALIIFSSDDCDYRSDSIDKGQLKITHFDSSQRIVSGRFHFTLLKDGCDTIKVTEGRFDIQDKKN